MISKEQLTGLWESDRAVSPVVGVALLIAITVILAAVIGFVVLDTTDADSAASTDARMSFTTEDTDSDDTDELRVKHEGGDSISSADIKVVGPDGTDLTSNTNFQTGGDSMVNTGEGMVVDYADGSVSLSSGDEITVVYDDPDSNRETVLGTFTAE